MEQAGALKIQQEPFIVLAEYARVSIAFTVETVFDVTSSDARPGTFELSERRIEVPYLKDYDAINDEGPLEWARHFDLSDWAFFTARADARLVGGAAVAFDSPEVKMLEGRRDLALLWDIRVAADVRGRGVGAALFEKAEAWARLRGCRQLKIETQNTNVPACRFYERHGCRLRAIDRAAYRDFPEEIQMLWYKDLPR